MEDFHCSFFPELSRKGRRWFVFLVRRVKVEVRLLRSRRTHRWRVFVLRRGFFRRVIDGEKLHSVILPKRALL